MVGLVVEHQQAAAGPEAAQQALEHLGVVLVLVLLAAIQANLAVEGAALVAL